MLLDSFTQGSLGKPGFRRLYVTDRNPLGGTTKLRLVRAPNESMRVVHGRLIRWLRGLDVDLSHAIGSRPGGSQRKSATLHQHSKHIYIVDIHKAFRNVDGPILAGILCDLEPKLAGYEEEVVGFLARYCLAPEGGLLTGLPASPDFFNTYVAVLIDEVLAPLCEAWGVTFSRYLDDLIFSSQEPIGRRKRRVIRDVIENAWFWINHEKSGVYDLTKGAVVINGIGIRRDRRGRASLFVPRFFVTSLLGKLHEATWHGGVSLSQIEGMMGVFEATTPYPKTRLEWKVFFAYARCRQVLAAA
jgi:hypothetical protein